MMTKFPQVYCMYNCTYTHTYELLPSFFSFYLGLSCDWGILKREK